MFVANESTENVLESLLQREQEERLALASDASTILSKLNISVDKLPQKSQQLLREASTAELRCQVEPSAVGVTLCSTREELAALEDDYQMLLLKQKNKELQAKIDHNAKEIEQLKLELSQSRTRLNQQNPNPENIDQYCRQMKQKLASYEDSCQRAQAKYKSLGVSGGCAPAALVSLAGTLGARREHAGSLRQRAQHAELGRRARTHLTLITK